MLIFLNSCATNEFNPISSNAYTVKASERFPPPTCHKAGIITKHKSPLYDDYYHVNKLRELAFNKGANFIQLPYKESNQGGIGDIEVDAYICNESDLGKIKNDPRYDQQ